MNTDKSKCPHCGVKITNFGVISANPIVDERKNALLNEYCEPKYDFRCTKCAEEVMYQCIGFLRKEREELMEIIRKQIPKIPVASVHSPQGWEYSIIDLVTAQSTLGTGLITDIGSAFTDLFGRQSQLYNKKIRDGEEICKAQLRSNALRVGASAVIGVDVDYTDMGGDKSMVCVCMTGTAVRLLNPAVHDAQLESTALRLQEAIRRVDYLASIEPNIN
jgi:uncharacterized protein YbjQ (UPF0145 family)